MITEPLPPEVYARVFEGMPEGAQILEELVVRFHRPAVVEGGIDAILKTYQREGARKVVDFICTRINMAHGVTNYDDETV